MSRLSELNPKEAEFAHHFLRVLGHDLSFSQQGANEKTLEAVLENNAVFAADKSVDWKATAEKLVASLNHLIPDKIDMVGDVEKTTPRNLSEDAIKTLTDTIVEIGAESDGDTPAEMAKRLRGVEFQNPNKPTDPKAKESLYEFLIRSGQEGGGYNLTTNQDMLRGLMNMLNQFSPKLGDLLMGFVNGQNVIHSAPEDGEALDALAQGYNFVMMGGEMALAELNGLPLKDEKDNPIYYNNFNGPNTDDQNGHAFEDFFDGTYRQKPNSEEYYGFKLGHGGPEFAKQSFEEMVVKSWEKQGVVSFSSEDKQVRADFIAYAKQSMLGGQVGGEFVDHLFEQELFEFDENMSAEQIAEFKGDLLKHVESLDMKQWDSAHETANSIVRFVKDREPDVQFHGVSEPAFRPDTEMNAFTSVRNDLEGVLEDYRRVNNGQEFAKKMMKYADDTPGVTVGMGVKADPEPVSQDIAYVVPETEPPKEGAALKHKITQHEAQNSPAGGAPVIDHSGDTSKMTLGGQSAADKFGVCATGANAVLNPTPCLPFDLNVEAKNDPSFWEKPAEEQVSSLLTGAGGPS